MRYLSICAFVKDENVYLPEWIEYHKLLGVEHFYLFDNGSAVPVARTLAKDIQEGWVTVTVYPGRGLHVSAFGAGLSQYGKESHWMAFIDIDEYLVPSEGGDVREFLKDYERYGGVGVNWVMFGSAGHLERPEGLQIENFTMRTPDTYSANTHIKSIIQPAHTTGVLGTHSFSTRSSHPVVNERGAPIGGAFSPFSIARIRINHYWTRSRREFEEKIRRGRSDGVPDRTMAEFESVDRNAVVRDTLVLRFAPALLERLRARSTFGR